ncbi:hypothetical protein Rs2_06356 [Raphanus sativus]|nr:hypothetical protein Rs2_06356 [Raphanus sativus]
MAERKASGLCFNCDDLYNPRHVCSPALFHIVIVLDGENQDDELIDNEELKISLNVMNGENTERTFQVQADINKDVGWILLDTGSTHNFIKSSMVEKLGIPMNRRPWWFVSLPDGGKCQIAGLCHGVSMNVQGHSFKADCFAIPLTGFDVVLGIRWLNALGRVVWDGPNRTVEFQHGLEKITWHSEAITRGKGEASLHAIRCDTRQLEDWFSEDMDEVFTTPGEYDVALSTQEPRISQQIWTLDVDSVPDHEE